MIRRWLVAIAFIVWTPLLVVSTYVASATAPASVALAAASPSPTPSTDPSAGATCDDGGLTWAVCPIISGIADLVDGIMKDIIQPFLQVSPLTQTVAGGGPNPSYTIWQNFRNVASVLMILVFFAIIFGTAIGFDNYTIKKTMPHLIAGAILIPFSWYICVIMVDAGNVLGQGMISLMDSFIPKPNIDFSTSISQIMGLLAGGLVLITLKGAGSEMGLALLLTILFAVLATMFTLVLRQILIIVLVVLSPFAFLAWILPNTQSIYSQWWKNLTRLILMYPLVMLIFEAGRIFADTAGATFAVNGAGAGGTDYLKASAVPFIQLAGLFLPLAAVPWTYKWAGGAMTAGAAGIGRLSGAANKRWGRGSDSDKKARARQDEKGANAWMKTPITRLGRRMQQADEKTGEYFHPRLAKLNQSFGAIRAGQSGALPGQGPSIAQQRALAGTATKAQSDEITAKTARAMVEQELKNGSYQEYPNRIKEAQQAKLVAAERVARKEMLDRMQTKGVLDDLGSLTRLATGDQTNVAGFQGQIAREAAIQHLAKIDDWGDPGDSRPNKGGIRKAWADGKITDDMMRNALDGVTTAPSKARDIALNLSGQDRAIDPVTGERTGPLSDLKRMEKFDGRNASNWQNFDKSTRWEGLRRLELLKAASATDPAQQKIRDKYSEDTANAFYNLAVQQSWGSIDNPTRERIADEVHDKAGRAHDLGLTPTQKAKLKLRIGTDGNLL